MAECSIFKNKALYGLITLIVFFLLFIFDKVIVLYINNIILTITNLFILLLSAFLMQQYINCIFKYNEDHSPPQW